MDALIEAGTRKEPALMRDPERTGTLFLQDGGRCWSEICRLLSEDATHGASCASWTLSGHAGDLILNVHPRGDVEVGDIPAKTIGLWAYSPGHGLVEGVQVRGAGEYTRLGKMPRTLAWSGMYEQSDGMPPIEAAVLGLLRMASLGTLESASAAG